MRFKPVTKKYNYSSETLIENIPVYMHGPIASWVLKILQEVSLFHGSTWDSDAMVDPTLINRLNVLFRESFPARWDSFLNFLFSEKDRTINFLAFCLQNFAYDSNATALEEILADGGSAWKSISTFSESFDRGTFELVRRVPEIVQEQSKKAISEEKLLREAWVSCYSHNPKYEETVSKCVDALEGLFRDRYFPKDSKPVLSKFIKDLAADAAKLSYNGDSLVNPKNLLTDLAKDFATVRGQHTKGSGRLATKEEAEFVLHYTIFLWNIHQ